nr:superinfection immunity protein [Polymorphobacter sp.]
MDTQNLLFIGVLIIAVLAFNFVPAMIAYARHHPERALLARLNILSLLSFLLWFALLVWAVGGKRDDGIINRFVGNAENRGWLIGLVVLLVGIGVGTTAYALATG